MRRILGAVAAVATLVAAAQARADDGRRVVGPASPSPYDSRWTSPGYPRSWSPADAPSAADRRAATSAVPPTVTVAPPTTARRVVPPCPPPAALSAAPVAPCPPRAIVESPRERRLCLTIDTWVRYWRPQISGSTYITIGGEPGTASRIEVDDDLDLEDDDGAWAAGVAVSLNRHRAFVEYEKLSFDGETTLSAPVVFHGVTYAAGDDVRSSLDLTIWKAGYDFALIDEPQVDVRAGPSAWLWTFDQRLTSSTEDESREFSHVLPVAHVEADARFGVAHASARAAVGWIGENRWVIDLSAAAGVRFFDSIALDVGWRWMRFSFDETTNEGDLTFCGPFVSLSADF